MLDTWLAASSWSSTSEVISLAVSLGSLPSGVSPRPGMLGSYSYYDY